MIAIRRMQNAEFERIVEIDRTEDVREIYVNRDGTLVQKNVDWHITQWPPPEEEVKRWRHMLAEGSTLFGAFDGKTLVGFSIYRPGLSRDTAQLAALFVSKGYRGQKIGTALVDTVAEMAKADGAKKLYVSSIPTTRTVDFYRMKGFDLAREVNEQLFELEPEDIHMIRNL